MFEPLALGAGGFSFAHLMKLCAMLVALLCISREGPRQKSDNLDITALIDG
jgi:hypothetical protein